MTAALSPPGRADVREVVREYIDARDEYERATFSGNYTPPKSLRHDSPIMNRWRRAREALDALSSSREGS